MAVTALRNKLFAVLGAVVFMVALPAACYALRSIGPATRVVFYDYLPLVDTAAYVFAAVLGAALGADAQRWVPAPDPHAARRRLPRVRLAALALLAAWVAWPQLRAFPASASVAERDAWARVNVRHYASLARIVAALPEVQKDIGRMRAIAPTSQNQHIFAREMDGDDMRFTLDVIGEKGRGTFYADCTLDDYRVFDWRAGRWSFRGHDTRIDRVPERVPP